MLNSMPCLYDFNTLETDLNWNGTGYHEGKGTKFYSQLKQDLVAIDILKPNKNNKNYFLDFGCWLPVHENNTYLLEKDYNFTGLSFDFDSSVYNHWKNNKERNFKNFINVDLNKTNFESILDMFYTDTKTIDYFTFDLEPPQMTLEILKKFPFNNYDFKFITYEHDGYRFHQGIDESRRLFESHGYKRLNTDYMNSWSPTSSKSEDWYINPKYIQVDNNILA